MKAFRSQIGGKSVRPMEYAKTQDDSRQVVDRRGTGWRTVFYGFMRSRRRAHRRHSEVEPIFTDWHHPWLFFLGTGIMLLSTLDAFFTVKLLEQGAIEVNPLMSAVMGKGTVLFPAIKMLLTAFGILVLVYLARSRLFNKLRAGTILTMFFSLYCCLVCYEFVLLVRIL